MKFTIDTDNKTIEIRRATIGEMLDIIKFINTIDNGSEYTIVGENNKPLDFNPPPLNPYKLTQLDPQPFDPFKSPYNPPYYTTIC